MFDICLTKIEYQALFQHNFHQFIVLNIFPNRIPTNYYIFFVTLISKENLKFLDLQLSGVFSKVNSLKKSITTYFRFCFIKSSLFFN